jgi:hypothetical protein
MSPDSKGDYPFVFVNDDGSVREVTILEKLYLQTKYSGGDGDRPYIKIKYSEKNGWGEMSGFCYRAAVPGNVEVHQTVEAVSKEAIESEIRRLRALGYEIDLTGIAT